MVRLIAASCKLGTGKTVAYPICKTSEKAARTISLKGDRERAVSS